MLKRCQILLEPWQEEYLKDVAARYDQSFSEIVRVILSAGFLHIINLLHPEYKPGVSPKQLAEMTKTAGDHNTSIEEQHRLVSKVYFESRKAVEYRQAKIKESKNKPTL